MSVTEIPGKKFSNSDRPEKKVMADRSLIKTAPIEPERSSYGLNAGWEYEVGC